MGREEYFRLLSRSLCVSVDLAHALHPNYADKHEPRHPLLLNEGVAIKTNAQYRYASDAHSCAAIIALCKKHKIPYQKYAAKGDIPAGTTIGPIHANLTGMPTVDIGPPQLSMHSCRELMGIQDYFWLSKLVQSFYASQCVSYEESKIFRKNRSVFTYLLSPRTSPLRVYVFGISILVERFVLALKVSLIVFACLPA